jgi:alpha-mannosidase
MDQGWHNFSMQILPHAGGWRDACVPRLAWAHNAPCLPHVESAHVGKRPRVASMLEIDAPNIVLSVFKQQEDGHGIILRGYETAGIETAATLKLPAMEQETLVQFAPYEIKSFHLNPETWALVPVDLLEEAR